MPEREIYTEAAAAARLLRVAPAFLGLLRQDRRADSLVAQVAGQDILTPAAREFDDRVSGEDGVAARWRPDANAASPAVVDPDGRFGAASVGSISTSNLREQDLAGEDETDVAEAFGLALALAHVQWVLVLVYRMAANAA